MRFAKKLHPKRIPPIEINPKGSIKNLGELYYLLAVYNLERQGIETRNEDVYHEFDRLVRLRGQFFFKSEGIIHREFLASREPNPMITITYSETCSYLPQCIYLTNFARIIIERLLDEHKINLDDFPTPQQGNWR